MKNRTKNLPPITPSLMPASIDFSTFFNNNNPLELEIGTGRPHFLFARAAFKKDHNIIGIEWKRSWVLQANKKILREKITNVLPLHGNAWTLAPLIFEDNSLSNIVVNFPDPWWKDKHRKRRVLNEIFNCH